MLHQFLYPFLIHERIVLFLAQVAVKPEDHKSSFFITHLHELFAFDLAHVEIFGMGGDRQRQAHETGTEKGKKHFFHFRAPLLKVRVAVLRANPPAMAEPLWLSASIKTFGRDQSP